eukprot:CAMPEP_0178389532 /NCGR_PEP_ID=MMETSP0689_2-20121128/10169_1 /TAXON_ID=160604 /ORGANISM="Amphidinium massartii, Strain CS-259" /LENGTH=62 /DNA_ID=CAMNT_0020009993 /DNA_START=321 /DNA_END=505 /DNA_ORIENTATION=+
MAMACQEASHPAPSSGVAQAEQKSLPAVLAIRSALVLMDARKVSPAAALRFECDLAMYLEQP